VEKVGLGSALGAIVGVGTIFLLPKADDTVRPTASSADASPIHVAATVRSDRVAVLESLPAEPPPQAGTCDDAMRFAASKGGQPVGVASVEIRSTARRHIDLRVTRLWARPVGYAPMARRYAVACHHNSPPGWKPAPAAPAQPTMSFRFGDHSLRAQVIELSEGASAPPIASLPVNSESESVLTDKQISVPGGEDASIAAFVAHDGSDRSIQFVLELDLTVNGNGAHFTMDDGGRPFVVNRIPRSSGTRTLEWSEDTHRWADKPSLDTSSLHSESSDACALLSLAEVRQILPAAKLDSGGPSTVCSWSDGLQKVQLTIENWLSPEDATKQFRQRTQSWDADLDPISVAGVGASAVMFDGITIATGATDGQAIIATKGNQFIQLQVFSDSPHGASAVQNLAATIGERLWEGGPATTIPPKADTRLHADMRFMVGEWGGRYRSLVVKPDGTGEMRLLNPPKDPNKAADDGELTILQIRLEPGLTGRITKSNDPAVAVGGRITIERTDDPGMLEITTPHRTWGTATYCNPKTAADPLACG